MRAGPVPREGTRGFTELFFRSNGVKTYSAGVIVSDKLLKNDPNLVQRFVCATLESLELAQKRTGSSTRRLQRLVTQEDWGCGRALCPNILLTTYFRSAGCRPGEHRPGYHDERGCARRLRPWSDGGRAPVESGAPSLVQLSYLVGERKTAVHVNRSNTNSPATRGRGFLRCLAYCVASVTRCLWNIVTYSTPA